MTRSEGTFRRRRVDPCGKIDVRLAEGRMGTNGSPRERRKALPPWRKKSNIPRYAASRNHPFRTKRTSLARKGYLPRRNVYQQDELSPQHKVALFALNKVAQGPTPFVGPKGLFSLPNKIFASHQAPEKARSCKPRNINTCANRARNPLGISTSVFKDLKPPGINTSGTTGEGRASHCYVLHKN
jgi:hypothetical protein